MRERPLLRRALPENAPGDGRYISRPVEFRTVGQVNRFSVSMPADGGEPIRVTDSVRVVALGRDEALEVARFLLVATDVLDPREDRRDRILEAYRRWQAGRAQR